MGGWGVGVGGCGWVGAGGGGGGGVVDGRGGGGGAVQVWRLVLVPCLNFLINGIGRHGAGPR